VSSTQPHACTAAAACCSSTYVTYSSGVHVYEWRTRTRASLSESWSSCPRLRCSCGCRVLQLHVRHVLEWRTRIRVAYPRVAYTRKWRKRIQVAYTSTCVAARGVGISCPRPIVTFSSGVWRTLWLATKNTRASLHEVLDLAVRGSSSPLPLACGICWMRWFSCLQLATPSRMWLLPPAAAPPHTHASRMRQLLHAAAFLLTHVEWCAACGTAASRAQRARVAYMCTDGATSSSGGWHTRASRMWLLLHAAALLPPASGVR
jgi:hypothetical protein